MELKGIREGKNGGPFTVRTNLGWMINGPLGRSESKILTANFIDADSRLENEFGDFCNLEFNDSSYEPKASMSQNDHQPPKNYGKHCENGGRSLPNWPAL